MRDLRQVMSRYNRFAIVIFVLIVVIGFATAFVTSLDANLQRNFSWNFLATMLGSAVTFLAVNVLFQRVTDDTLKRYEERAKKSEERQQTIQLEMEQLKQGHAEDLKLLRELQMQELKRVIPLVVKAIEDISPEAKMRKSLEQLANFAKNWNMPVYSPPSKVVHENDETEQDQASDSE